MSIAEDLKHVPTTPANVPYPTIKSERGFMKPTVKDAVGRGWFVASLLFRFIPRPTSNSSRKNEEIEQNRLLLAIAGFWLLSFFGVAVWVWHVVYG